LFHQVISALVALVILTGVGCARPRPAAAAEAGGSTPSAVIWTGRATHAGTIPLRARSIALETARTEGVADAPGT
jgi:hypothetical protein